MVAHIFASIGRNPFVLSPEYIERRLRRRLSSLELFALLFAVGMTFVFAYLDSVYEIGAFPDFRAFRLTAEGIYESDAGGYFYAHWFIPVFEALNLLPLPVGYVVWGIINIAGIWFAARVFGGHTPLALLSYQMLYVLYYGNIVGVIAAGLALLWWGLHRGRGVAAGIGWVIALTKFQLGIPIGLILWLFAQTDWRTRLRAVLVVLAIFALSLIVYPTWIETLYRTTQARPPDTRGSISLWQYIGVGSLLCLLPPLILNLPTHRRIVALVAAVGLALPYFQQTDLLVLYMLPIGAVAVLGNIGYLFAAFAWLGLKPLIFILALVYGWALIGRRSTKQEAVS